MVNPTWIAHSKELNQVILVQVFECVRNFANIVAAQKQYIRITRVIKDRVHFAYEKSPQGSRVAQQNCPPETDGVFGIELR